MKLEGIYQQKKEKEEKKKIFAANRSIAEVERGLDLLFVSHSNLEAHYSCSLGKTERKRESC